MGQKGPLEADSHVLLSSQFTQSALDCMSAWRWDGHGPSCR